LIASGGLPVALAEAASRRNSAGLWSVLGYRV
jgi:hypothetical protein